MRRLRPLPVPPANRLVISVIEAAALLGVGESTVRDMIKRNEIPFTRIGRRIVLRRDLLLQMTEPAPVIDQAPGRP